MLLTARCPVCERAVSDACASCWSAALPAPGSAPVPAAVAFVGAGRRLVLALKYGNGRRLARPLARQVAELVEPGCVDLVTWAPTSAGRLRRRGYDQAELLARAVARELGVPCRRLLRRSGRAVHQTGRDRAARTADPPTFVARRLWTAPRVLVVDDVVTTGATLRAARHALERAGCRSVLAVAGAATP